MTAYHCDDLKVFQVCSLCGQNLFGNEVGLVSGISLWEERALSVKATKVQSKYMMRKFQTFYATSDKNGNAIFPSFCDHNLVTLAAYSESQSRCSPLGSVMSDLKGL